MKVLRYELKYYVSFQDYLYLKSVLSHTLQPDPHAKEDGHYFVRSLYFDTPHDMDYEEKLLGVHDRKKIRARIYGTKDSKVKLEMKAKHGQMLEKTSLTLPRDQYELYLTKGPSALNGYLLDKEPALGACLLSHYYRPAVIIDYEREAYVHSFSNIRVNFDKNIRYHSANLDIGQDNLSMKKIHDPHLMVLEVKFDHFLPSWLREVLCQVDLTQTSISKYCLSRTY